MKVSNTKSHTVEKDKDRAWKLIEELHVDHEACLRYYRGLPSDNKKMHYVALPWPLKPKCLIYTKDDIPN